MDPLLSEDEALFSQDPLDVVEHVLEAENLKFDRTEKGDVAFTLSGGWRDFGLCFTWRPDVDCLQVSLSLDMCAPAALRGQVFELLAGVNARASLGLFEMREDGEILFRFGTPLLPGEYPGLGPRAGMIDVAKEGAERVFPACELRIRCGKRRAEARAA
ncbi:MAG: YbjN domain-containing protein, partial [Phenylobacterium sp.]